MVATVAFVRYYSTALAWHGRLEYRTRGSVPALNVDSVYARLYGRLNFCRSKWARDSPDRDLLTIVSSERQRVGAALEAS